MRKKIISEIEEHGQLIGSLAESCLEPIKHLAEILLQTLKAGNKIIVFGNGGSASDAQHFVCELVGSFRNKNRRALPAIALTTNTSNLTSISNDFGYEEVFKRQVEALAQKGDLCIGISTSGRSPNVYEALAAAGKMGCKTAALLGNDGGIIKKIADCSVIVPSDSTPRIQEAHIFIIHILCAIVDEAFSKK
ncbi:MAG: D-sedoheptulose 7-phosphate isomerase [Candidatus Sumerlaeota bacterium]|nr:D-sedoheptulose 7-phosphate isomerase [Candidatus Sumerlaeota bacterium]